MSCAWRADLSLEPRTFDENSAQAQQPRNGPFLFMHSIYEGGYSWGAARAYKGQSQCAAVLEALGKLLGWHWLQPALYFALFVLNWSEIDTAQKVFGVGVAIREAFYFLSTCLCLWTNPAFLLVDVGATVRTDKQARYHILSHNGYVFLAMYVVAPEKFVAMALCGWQNRDAIPGLGLKRLEAGMFYSLFCILLDVCSVGALISGLVSGSLPAGLAIGYVATALACLGFLAAIVLHIFGVTKNQDLTWCSFGCIGCLAVTAVAVVALAVWSTV